MKATYIDYSDTRSFSSALIRFLDNDPELESFSSYKADFKGFHELLKNRKFSSSRTILQQVLTEQYSKLPSSVHPEVKKNIDSLLLQNTYTVCTGHQLNIFTGPLYFIFKIVTAINLAKDLKKRFPDNDFVPVYWMATEDHDFAEINHTYISDKKISWDQKSAGATGRLETKGIEGIIREYTGTLGLSDYAEELSRMIKSAYTENQTLADATRHLVNSLFEEYGLVILDADDKKLKTQFSSIITEDIIHQNSFRNISETNRNLQDKGIEPQVNPREINFFYLLDELRERIVYEDGLYKILNSDIAFNERELKLEIDEHPERFSPNVIMRPLYQEIVLPNLAYIGGGAEIMYWLQLKQNFDHYGIDFPILLLRNSAMITGMNLNAKLNRLDLTFQDIFKETETLKKEWVLAHSTHTLDLNAEWNEINSIFEKINLRTYKIDPTLGPSAEAIKVRLQKAFKNLEAKVIKAEKRNFSDATTQIEAIKIKLFPNGGLQERRENFGSFYVKYGKNFIQTLMDHFKPLELKFTILEE